MPHSACHERALLRFFQVTHHDWMVVGKRKDGNMIQKNWQERSEEHTSELQSRENLVCRLLLEKKKRSPPAPPAPGRKRRSGAAAPAPSGGSRRRRAAAGRGSRALPRAARPRRGASAAPGFSAQRPPHLPAVAGSAGLLLVGDADPGCAPLDSDAAHQLRPVAQRRQQRRPARRALGRPLLFFFLMRRRPPRSTLFPYTTLFR